MTRDHVIHILRAHEPDLTQMGVIHAAVFGSVARGSVARGDDREDSDVDIIIEIDPVKVHSIFAMGRIQNTLEGWIGRPVDVARRDRLRPGVGAEAERDAAHAF